MASPEVETPAAPPRAPATEAPAPAPAPVTRPAIEVSGETPNTGPVKVDPANGDKFLKEATNQYIEGHIDQPLWTRALAQANGDKELATPIYLIARATALRVLDRELRAKTRRATQVDDQRDAGSAPRYKPQADEENTAYQETKVGLNYRLVGAVGGIVALVAVVVWAFVALRTNVPPPVAATVAPAETKAAAAALAEKTAALNAENDKRLKAEFQAKIAELNATRNWNVLVLYANEWTRREPTNPAAWTQLSIGYANLKQFSDAQNAATHAVKLAPQDPAVWRNLGQLSMMVNKPEEALLAFEGAIALDERDAESLVQTGILQARLGHLPEAQRAIDKALTIVPEDPQTQCLKVAIAQKARTPKDAPGAKAAPNSSPCSDLLDPPAPTVPVAETAPKVVKSKR